MFVFQGRVTSAEVTALCLASVLSGHAPAGRECPFSEKTDITNRQGLWLECRSGH